MNTHKPTPPAADGASAVDPGASTDPGTDTGAGDTPAEGDSGVSGDAAVAQNGCDPGLEPSSDGSTACMDIDECAADPGPCPEHARCDNKVGGFTCICDNGYEDVHGDGTVCTSACASAGCDPAAECQLIDGKPECSCPATHIGDGKTCTFDASCANLGCDANAMCVVSGSQRQCMCLSGYTGSGMTCTNVDDCKPVNPCQNGGTCTDKVGAVACSCPAGWGGERCEIKRCIASSCGARQNCEQLADGIRCSCRTDAVCSSLAGVCTQETKYSCSQDGDGCFYSLNPLQCAANQSCSGRDCVCDANAMCSQGTGSYNYCSGTSTYRCSADGNQCAVTGSPTACTLPAGLDSKCADITCTPGTGSGSGCGSATKTGRCGSSNLKFCDVGRCVDCRNGTGDCGLGFACESNKCVELCGNGRVDPSETCDPGINNANILKCSPDCKTRWNVYGACDDGSDCNPAAPRGVQCVNPSGTGGKFCAPSSGVAFDSPPPAVSSIPSLCPNLDGVYVQRLVANTSCVVDCSLGPCPPDLNTCTDNPFKTFGPAEATRFCDF